MGEYLQNLFYYVAHNVPHSDEIFHALMKYDAHELFPQDEDGVVVWIDPKEHYTAITSVARSGNELVLRHLLKLAAKAMGGVANDDFRMLLTYPNKQLYSPLSTAAQEGHAAVIARLCKVAKKAFGDIQSDEFRHFLCHQNVLGDTPLSAAARGCASNRPFSAVVSEGHLESLRTLLEAGRQAFADDPINYQRFLEHKDRDGNTPLLTAVRAGRKEVVELLIEYGADPTIPNRSGKCAEDYSAENYDAGVGTSQATHAESTMASRPSKRRRLDFEDDAGEDAGNTADAPAPPSKRARPLDEVPAQSNVEPAPDPTPPRSGPKR